MPRTGRRGGDSGTRDAILAAARTAFGQVGYDRATIRGIAATAGVDPALVMHYFGTKADLYTAAIDMPFVPSVLLPGVIGDTRAGMGERLARAFFNAWEDRLSREPLVAMLRGATTGNDQGVVAFREFIISGLLARIAPLLDAPDARLRLELAMSHMVGIAVIRYLVGLEPLASASIEEIVELVAPRIEAYLNP